MPRGASLVSIISTVVSPDPARTPYKSGGEAYPVRTWLISHDKLESCLYIRTFTGVATRSLGHRPYTWEPGSLITGAGTTTMQSVCSPIA